MRDPISGEAALRPFDLPEAAINEDRQVVMPWANQILPAAGIVRNIPAEEDDAASVISVASSGAPPGKRREILTLMPRSRAKLMVKLVILRLLRCSQMKMSLKPRVRKSLNSAKKSNVSCMRPMTPLPPQERDGCTRGSAYQQVVDPFFFGSVLLGSSPGRSALQSAE